MVHPYFVVKAETIFRDAGGDPANSLPLAEWTETARNRDDVHGVIVARDGRLLAETCRTGGLDMRWTVVSRPLISAADDVEGWVADFATARLARVLGQDCMHVARSGVCFGSAVYTV